MASCVLAHWAVAFTVIHVVLLVTVCAQYSQLARQAQALYSKRLLFKDLPRARMMVSSGQLGQNYRALIFSAYDEFLYVGGKEELLKVNTASMEIVVKATLNSTIGSCVTECFNFVRLIQPFTDTDLFVCGTDAKKPKCYFADSTDLSLTTADPRFSRDDMVPLEPHQNFSWFYDDEENELFMTSGTGESQSSDDFNFARVNLTSPELPFDDNTELTADKSPNVLLRPDFVGDPIIYGERIFFFFRELALEHINGGKIIFSRVGTVCKNDTGGVQFTEFYEEFTSYQKARLDCSLRNDDVEFNYNELQDVYRVNNTIFTVFTTPRSYPASSAVCAYSLDEIVDIFLEDRYKGQARNGELWTLKALESSNPGIFKCNAIPYPTSYHNTILDYPLKYRLVPNKLNYMAESDFGRASDAPLLLMDDVRFSQIVVEKQVNGVDVIFLGTERGTVIKAYMKDDYSAAFLVEEIDIDEDRLDEFQAPIVTMLARDGYIFAGTDLNVYKVPMESCASKACDCDCSQDPYCVYNSDTKSCEPNTAGTFPTPNYSCSCPVEAEIDVTLHQPCENQRDRNTADPPPCKVSRPSGQMAHLNFAAHALEGANLVASLNCTCKTQPDLLVSNTTCRGRTFLTAHAEVNVTEACTCSLVFSTDKNSTILDTNLVVDNSKRIEDSNCIAEASKYDDEISKYKFDLRNYKRQTANNACQQVYHCHSCIIN